MGIYVFVRFFMKKFFLSLLPIMFLIIGVLCGCGQKNATDSDATSTADAQGVTAPAVIASPDESGAAISKIAGFTADAEVKGMSFPYITEDSELTVASIGAYRGEYVEDGIDEEVQNVAAIVVQNTSDKPVLYATVTVKDTADNEYTFVLSTLPVGHSAVVLEAEKQIYTSGAELAEITASVTECDELNKNSDKVSLRFDGEKLCLENLTDTDYRAVYVRYKNYTDGNVYLGGITYNASFESVAAGGTYEYEPAHFLKDSSVILMVEIVE